MEVIDDTEDLFHKDSSLNKRGSACFARGTFLVRLQDYSLDLNYFNEVVWRVTNHNLIRRYVYIRSDDTIAYYRATDRYMRWLPQYSFDYLALDSVPGEDEASDVGIIFPTRGHLEIAMQECVDARQLRNLPPICNYMG